MQFQKGKQKTKQHYLLTLELHWIENIIHIVSCLGHCLDSSLTCEIETAEATKS